MVQSTERNWRVWDRIDPLVAAVIAYVVLAVPAYFWLEGPVGGAGTVDGSVVIAALAVGSILFVPIIKAGLERRGDESDGPVGGPWEGNE